MLDTTTPAQNTRSSNKFYEIQFHVFISPEFKIDENCRFGIISNLDKWNLNKIRYLQSKK